MPPAARCSFALITVGDNDAGTAGCGLTAEVAGGLDTVTVGCDEAVFSSDEVQLDNPPMAMAHKTNKVRSVRSGVQKRGELLPGVLLVFIGL